MQLKISIITASFNIIQAGRQEAFLRMLTSVRCQSYPHIEHIIVDGASTDGTVELLKELNCTFISEPDTGIYDAMNKGYHLATGDYIGILNTDDYYHDQNGINKIALHLKTHPMDYAYSDVTFYNLDNKETKVIRAKPDNILASNGIPHQGFFITKKAFNRLGGYDVRYKIAADRDLMLSLYLSRHTGVKIPGNFVTFVSGGISDQERGRTFEEVLAVYQKKYAHNIQNGTDLYQYIIKGCLPLHLLKALWKQKQISNIALFKQLLRLLNKTKHSLKHP